MHAHTFTIILAIRYEARITDTHKASIGVTALSIDTQTGGCHCRNKTFIEI